MTADGRAVVAVRPSPPRRPAVQGYHARGEGQRLDLIAAHYLHDATAFHQLCDANDAMVPDALASHDLVGIPAKGA